MKKLTHLITIFGITLFCTSCSTPVSSEDTKQQVDSSLYIKCKEPRPEICTREYNPVCATVKTSVVCVTTPCPSAEEKTYATGCTACADPKVIKYRQGQCD